MGIFSRFENKMEDGLEGAAGKIFNAPISPVQISKKAEKAMRREKMVGAGKQYAPTLYTVLVNAEDDQKLFGYYPTIAGETETFLSARATEEGLTMDGQPLVRFIVDDSLKRGKFDVVAELVSAPIVAQLRREEMQRYGLLNKKDAAPVAAPVPAPVAPAAPAAPMAQPAPAQAIPVPSSGQRVDSGAFGHSAYADRLARSNSADIVDPLDLSDAILPKKQPLPYVPEEEIDRSIDYGEYTFNSQDFEDYEKHGVSAQLINPPAATPAEPEDDFSSYADLSGLDVESYSPYAHDSRDFAQTPPAQPAPAVNTQVFTGGAATPAPNAAAVRARLVNTVSNRDYSLTGGRLIIGRSHSCDITIDDINASRSHAELRYELQGVWVLTDLGSTNGTKVNGERISSTTLNTGDRVTIGTTDLLFLEG